MINVVSPSTNCRGVLLAALLLALLAWPATAAASSGARGTTQVKIYLVALGNGTVRPGTIGCGDTLVGVTKRIAPTSAPLTAAVRLLLADHHRYYGQSGLYNALYLAHLTVKRVALRNGRATVSLTGRMSSNGVCDAPRIKGQLERTALQFSAVRSVAFFVNGVPLQRVLSSK